MLLLLTIVIISVTPVIVDAVSTNQEECSASINRLETRVKALESENDTLAYKVRAGRMECTNAIARREEEFIKLLSDLERDIRQDGSRERMHQLEQVSYMVHGDTSFVATQEPVYQEEPFTRVSTVMKRIEDAKKCVKK